MSVRVRARHDRGELGLADAVSVPRARDPGRMADLGAEQGGDVELAGRRADDPAMKSIWSRARRRADIGSA